MKRRLSKVLLTGAVLSATIALGVAPSYAQQDPAVVGISDADWQQIINLGDLNGAFTEYVDNNSTVILVFTGGHVPTQLQIPPGYTYPAVDMGGEYSQFASNDQIPTIEDAAITAVINAGYVADATYNNDTDQIDLRTMAPASVTNPLATQYGSKIKIIAQSPGSPLSAHGSTKHQAKKHVVEKRAAKKQVTAGSAKKAPAPASTPREVTKVPLTPVKPQ
ncbi:hypothetical protein ACWD4O_23270 [Streptomyces sp. NPDC002623]